MDFCLGINPFRYGDNVVAIEFNRLIEELVNGIKGRFYWATPIGCRFDDFLSLIFQANDHRLRAIIIRADDQVIELETFWIFNGRSCD